MPARKIRNYALNKTTSVTTAENLRENIEDLADMSGTLMTDEHKPYRMIGGEFEGGHKTVEHGVYEYAKKDGSHAKESG